MDDTPCYDANYKDPENPKPIIGKKGWGVYQDNEDYYARGWIHVMPICDKKEHKFCLECSCDPTIDFNKCIVVHNAFDFRDAEEYAQTPKHMIE